MIKVKTDETIRLTSLRQRRENCWDMVQTFFENRDAHGVMDMGAEIQALNRAIEEVEWLAAQRAKMLLYD